MPASSRLHPLALGALLLATLAPATRAGEAFAAASRSPVLGTEAVLERIAFGSCLHQGRDQAILGELLADEPDLALFIGDNVYGDSEEPALTELREAYALQARSGPLNRIRGTTPVLATWDDHDYGLNDAGADYPYRAEARRLFMDFWRLAPEDLASTEGVYRARVVGPPGRRVQIVLLDTRSFRSPLRPTDAPGEPGRERYLPDPDPAATLLGEAQWTWLAKQLAEPAELRLIVSSIQVIADGHGWEAWRTLPAERERLYDLLRDAGAGGVVLLSGDRHRAGIYRHDEALGYPLFEITSSSLNLPLEGVGEEAGPFRLGGTFPGANYGRVDLDWDAGLITLQVLDGGGRTVRAAAVPLAALQPDA